MGAVKDFLIGVEELVYTAMEKGFTDMDGIYAYVYMYEPRVDRATVEAVMHELYLMDQMQLFVA